MRDNEEVVDNSQGRVSELVKDIIRKQSLSHQITEQQKENILDETKTYVEAYKTDPDQDINRIAEDAAYDLYHYIQSAIASETDLDKPICTESLEVQERISELSLSEIFKRIRCRCDEKRRTCSQSKTKKRLQTKDGEELGADLELYGIELESKQPCDVTHKKDLIDRDQMREKLKSAFDAAEDKIRSATELIITTKLRTQKRVPDEATERHKKREDRRKRKDSPDEIISEGLETSKTRDESDMVSLKSVVSEGSIPDELEEEQKGLEKKTKVSSGRSESDDAEDVTRDGNVSEKSLVKDVSGQVGTSGVYECPRNYGRMSEDEAMFNKIQRYDIVLEDADERRMMDKYMFDRIDQQYLDDKDSTVMHVVQETKSITKTEKVGTKIQKMAKGVLDDTVTLTKYHEVDTEEKKEYIKEFDTYINKSPSLSSHSSKSLILIKDETEEVDVEYMKRELFLKSDEARVNLQKLYRTNSESILRQFLSIKNYAKWYVDNLLTDAVDYTEVVLHAMNRLDEHDDVYQRTDVKSLVSDELFTFAYESYDMGAPPHHAEIKLVHSFDEMCNRKTLLDQTVVSLEEQDTLKHVDLKHKFGLDNKTDTVVSKEETEKTGHGAQTSVFVRKNYDDAIVTKLHQKHERQQSIIKQMEHKDKIHINPLVDDEYVIEKNETESVVENLEKVKSSSKSAFTGTARELGDRSLYFNQDGYPVDVMLDKSIDVETIKELKRIQHVVPQIEQVPSQTNEKTDTVTRVAVKIHTVTKISTHRTLSALHVHQTEQGEVLTFTSKKHSLDINIMLLPRKTPEAKVEHEIQNLKLSIGDFDVRFGYNLVLQFVSRWVLEDSWVFCIDYLREEIDSTSNYYTYEVKFSKPTAQAPIPKVTVSVFFTIEVSRIFPLKCQVNVTYAFEGTSCKYELDTVLQPEEFLNHILKSKLLLFKQIMF